MPPLLLLTRPLPLSLRFRDESAHFGLETVIAPIMEIVPVAHDAAIIAAAKGLIFTSVNGVAQAGPGRGRPAICVGPATGDAARAAGYAVTVGPGDADRMMPMLDGLGADWVHPHGAHVARKLPVTGVQVYDQVTKPLSNEGRAILAGQRAVLLPLFSPRSAQILSDEAQAARAPLWLVPISQAAADRWQAPMLRSFVAPTPDGAGILAGMGTLLGQAHS